MPKEVVIRIKGKEVKAFHTGSGDIFIGTGNAKEQSGHEKPKIEAHNTTFFHAKPEGLVATGTQTIEQEQRGRFTVAVLKTAGGTPLQYTISDETGEILVGPAKYNATAIQNYINNNK